VPLLSTLKNDALKQRHWEELMKITNVSFDQTSKVVFVTWLLFMVFTQSFTLAKLFAMELHRFKDQITAIVNHASQEAKVPFLFHS
jgi:dynein heavy chain